MEYKVVTEMNSNSRDLLGEAVSRDPRVAKAVSGLSGEDMSKLREVLADPEKTRQILSSPMAQQLIRQLSGKGGSES